MCTFIISESIYNTMIYNILTTLTLIIYTQILKLKEKTQKMVVITY